jgi:transmembrane sensor
MTGRFFERWRAARVRKAAARWMVRMHGPDAFRWRGRFESWRQACPSHARAYDRQLAIWTAAPGLTTSASAPVPRRAPVIAYALAASIVVLAFGMAGVRSWFWGERSPVLITAEPDTQRSLRLEDGSRVLLAGGSRLEVALGKDRRQITLTRGRVRLELRPEKRPAIVRAGPALVRATAASFDLRLDGGDAQVILLGGKIQLARYDAGPEAAALALEPGQLIELGDGSAASLPRRATATELAWPSGMISFDDAPLAEVIARANGLSLTRIELGDPSIGTLRVTGAYRMGDNDGMAQTLASSFGLTVVRLPDGGLRLVRRSR